jgi:glutamyl-tRNA reductase
MQAAPTLVLVGLSHRTAPVAVRERYVVATVDLPATLGALRGIDGVEEALVLSTCNRTEALVSTTRPEAVALAVRTRLFRNAATDEVYEWHGAQALFHLLRVAAGLDSLVVGESEVLGQLKRAADVAREHGALGALLESLVARALHAGKRVRAETDLGQGTLSVARVGVDVARRALGHFANKRALVVGAGETGVLVARHLKGLGVQSLCFANRTAQRASEAAAEFGAEACGLDELRARIVACDLLVACVEGQSAVVERSQFDARALQRRDLPLVVLDLSVPRAVEAAVAEIGGNVLLYDLDDLSRVVAENLRDRSAAADAATPILVHEAHEFLGRRAYQQLAPVLGGLKGEFETLRDATLDAVAGAQATPREVELAHELSKRLLHATLERLKDGAKRLRPEDALEHEYRRFLERL